MHFFQNRINFFKKLQFCCVSKDPIKYASPGVVFGSEFLEKFHQIVWVSGSDFHLPVAPGVKKPLWITESKKFSSQIHKVFRKILENSQKFSILLRCENPIKYASSGVVFGSELQKPWFSCFYFSPKSLKNYGFPWIWGILIKKLWFSCF